MFDGVVLFNRFGRASHQVLANASLLAPLGPQLVADFAQSSTSEPARIDISGKHYVVFRRTVSRFDGGNFILAIHCIHQLYGDDCR